MSKGLTEILFSLFEVARGKSNHAKSVIARCRRMWVGGCPSECCRTGTEVTGLE
jgi:hypothetical protein